MLGLGPQNRCSFFCLVECTRRAAEQESESGLFRAVSPAPGTALSTSDWTNVGFPGGSDGKESAGNVGDLGSVPGLGRSRGGGRGNPLQYSCLENPHGQRSLAGYSP